MADNKVDIGGWTVEAWELYKANFALMCLASLVAGLLGAFTCGVLAGPLWAGLTMIILRLLRKEFPAPKIGDVFKGFDFFLPALLLVVVIAVAFSAASFVPLIGQVAGIFLWPLVMFAMCLVVDRKMDFWPAIQASYEKAKDDYVPLLLLSLLSGVVVGVGALLCGVGVILTAPMGAAITVVAYRHLFEESGAMPAMEAPPIPPQA